MGEGEGQMSERSDRKHVGNAYLREEGLPKAPGCGVCRANQ